MITNLNDASSCDKVFFNFPSLPNYLDHAVNLLITLIHQANYLIDKLISSLKEKHMREGGLTEELYKKRVEYRKNH